MKNKDLTCEAWDLFNDSRQSVKKEDSFHLIFFTLLDTIYKHIYCQK